MRRGTLRMVFAAALVVAAGAVVWAGLQIPPAPRRPADPPAPMPRKAADPPPVPQAVKNIAAGAPRPKPDMTPAKVQPAGSPKNAGGNDLSAESN